MINKKVLCERKRHTAHSPQLSWFCVMGYPVLAGRCEGTFLSWLGVTLVLGWGTPLDRTSDRTGVPPAPDRISERTGVPPGRTWDKTSDRTGVPPGRTWDRTLGRTSDRTGVPFPQRKDLEPEIREGTYDQRPWGTPPPMDTHTPVKTLPSPSFGSRR